MPLSHTCFYCIQCTNIKRRIVHHLLYIYNVAKQFVMKTNSLGNFSVCARLLAHQTVCFSPLLITTQVNHICMPPYYLVCTLCCGCFNLFCNMWCMCGCFGNMCTCIYCVFVFSFMYISLFFYAFV